MGGKEGCEGYIGGRKMMKRRRRRVREKGEEWGR